MELGEQHGQLIRWRVNDRVPADDATERAVGEIERRHRPFPEPDVGVRVARNRDHRGRQVDAEHVQTERRQKRGNAAGPAPEVGNEPVACVVHELREHAEHRPIDRLVLELVAEERGVVDGDRVVGNATSRQNSSARSRRGPYWLGTHSLGSRTCPSSKKR